AQRGHATLAAQYLLDVAGHGLHAVDAGPVRMDLLRSLSAPVSSGRLWCGRRIFSQRDPHHGGAGAAAPSKAQGSTASLWLSGFCFSPDVVGIIVCLCGVSVDVCSTFGSALQLLL